MQHVLAGPAPTRPAGRVLAARAVVVLALVAIALVALPRVAQAHAALSSSTPADGAVLEDSPTTAAFTFNEPVSAAPGALRVFDADGARVDDGQQVQPTPEQVTIGLDDLPDGGYVATYLVTSADGHVIRGALTFQVGSGAAVDDATVAALFGGGAGVVGAVATAVRAVDLGAVLIAVGALVAAVAIVVPGRQRRLALDVAERAASVGIVTALVTLPLQAMVTSGLGLAAVVSGPVMRDVATSSVGVGSLTRVAGLLLVVATALSMGQVDTAVSDRGTTAPDRPDARRAPGQRTGPRSGGRAGTTAVFGVVGAVVLGLGSLLLDGHTRTVEPALVMLVGDAVHVVAGAVWAGGLVVVARVLWSLPAIAADPASAHGPRRRPEPLEVPDAGQGAVGAAHRTGTAVMEPASGGGRTRPHPLPETDAAPVADASADTAPDTGSGLTDLAGGGATGDETAAAATLLARWSGWALWSMLALVAAGSAMSWALVRAPRALVESDQGWTLLVKVSLVAVVVVIGAWNHWRLVPAITAHGPDEVAARRQLRSSVRVEVVLLALVLVATAVLVTLRPAAAEVGISGAFDTVVSLADDVDLNLVVDPNRAGANQVHLYLLDETGRPLDDDVDVALELVQVEEDLGPLRRTPRPAGPGHWVLSGSDLAIAGSWDVTAVVSRDAFTEERATVRVVVNPS